MIPTNDGGYAMIGYSAPNYSTSPTKIYLVKTQASGDTSWTRSYGGLGNEHGASIVQTAAGNYFIGGRTKYSSNGQFDFYLMKTNAAGDTLWTKKYGGSGNEEITSIVQSSDGGIVMAGYTESYGNGSKDMYLVKVDANGNLLWSKTYGGPLPEVANALRATPDGGYILAGNRNYALMTVGTMYIV